MLFNDLMTNLAWLFAIHDSDRDGFLTKDEILQVSEVLLVSSFFTIIDLSSYSLSPRGLNSSSFETNLVIATSEVSRISFRTCSNTPKVRNLSFPTNPTRPPTILQRTRIDLTSHSLLSECAFSPTLSSRTSSNRTSLRVGG